jgi:hypothetical protein
MIWFLKYANILYPSSLRASIHLPARLEMEFGLNSRLERALNVENGRIPRSAIRRQRYGKVRRLSGLSRQSALDGRSSRSLSFRVRKLQCRGGTPGF